MSRRISDGIIFWFNDNRFIVILICSIGIIHNIWVIVVGKYRVGVIFECGVNVLYELRIDISFKVWVGVFSEKTTLIMNETW